MTRQSVALLTDAGRRDRYSGRDRKATEPMRGTRSAGVDESTSDLIADPELESVDDAEDISLGDAAKKGTTGIIDPGSDH